MDSGGTLCDFAILVNFWRAYHLLENLLHDLIINYATLYRSAVAQVPINLAAASHPVASILFGVILAFIVFPDFILLNCWIVYYTTLLALLLVGVRITIHVEILIYAGITVGSGCYTSL
jgi:hypothetical protein